MSNSGVKVFSIQARFQDMEPLPSNRGICKGDQSYIGFCIVVFQAGNLGPIMWSPFSRNFRVLRTWDQFHPTGGIFKGDQSHRVFFISLIFMLEVYIHFCGQRFLETREVSGPGTNSIEHRGPVRVANHIGFLYIADFQARNLCSILWSTFSRNRRGFRTWDQFRRKQGICEGDESYRVLFPSSIFTLEI